MELDVISLAKKVEKQLANFTQPMTIALMGCLVNGPGEAKIADIGIAGGKGGRAMIYVGGKFLKRIKNEDALKSIIQEVKGKKKELRK